MVRLQETEMCLTVFLNSEQPICHSRKKKAQCYIKEQEAAGWLGNRARWGVGPEHLAIPRMGQCPLTSCPVEFSAMIDVANEHLKYG